MKLQGNNSVPIPGYPYSMVKRSILTLDRRGQMAFVLAIAVIAVGLFPLLYPRMGDRVAAIALLPILLAGWLFGLRIGLLAGLIGLVAIIGLFTLAGRNGLITMFSLWPGVLAAGLVGAIVGWVSDLVTHIKTQSQSLLSRQKALEKELTESKKTVFELSLALAHSMPGIAHLDAEGRYVSVNDGYAGTLGYAPDELIGRHWKTTIHPDDQAVAADAHKEMLATGRAEFEVRAVRKDRTVFDEQVLIVKLLDEKFEQTGCHCFIKDITERKRTEAAIQAGQEQIRQMQKMEAIGRLAGGVAHDFNNLLLIIQGHTEFLDENVSPAGPAHESLRQIDAAINKAAELTQQLLAFGRRQTIQPKVHCLNTLVTAMGAMLGRVIGEDIKLRFSLDPVLGCVKADLGQIDQILMNLALNARDAMPQGGTLTIETQNEFIKKDRDTLPAGHYVRLTVSDTGHGMDQDTLTHIFEPFFTTKDRGKGTGLGLATVYGIVKQNQGHIFVKSKPGAGTTLTLYFQRVQAEPDVDHAAKPAGVFAQLSRGTETILIVEDEPRVGFLLATKLRMLGYTVMTALSGHEALALARAHPGPIHLLITDVVMPGMNGREVADALRIAHPEIRVLYISGYPDNIIGCYGVLEPGIALLQKPFGTSPLASKVREVLTASPA